MSVSLIVLMSVTMMTHCRLLKNDDKERAALALQAVENKIPYLVRYVTWVCKYVVCNM